jgi:anti-sigma B factor antagonist
VDLKLRHYVTDGIEVIDVQGEIDMYTAPRLRELLIDLVSKGNYQLVVNLGKVGFLDSTGLGVLVGGLRRVRAHDGSLDLVCTQQRILETFRITGLTGGLRHLRDGGPGRRGHEGPPVRNAGLAEVGAETAPDQVDAERFAEWSGSQRAGVEDIRLS